MKKIIPFLVCLLVAVIACKKEDIFPLAESITFDDTSIELPVGESKYLYYTILPEQVGDTATVYFSSADESIARVSEWGSVTGVKEGHTTVTATVHGKTASIEVEVLKAVITKFNLKYNGEALPEVLDVPYGDNAVSVEITDIKPSTVGPEGITVSSKDKSIAEAKRDGKQVIITPKGEGETTIVVRGGDVKKEINISVKMIHAEKVVIDQKNPEVGLNTTLQLTATTTPVDISQPKRTWSSSNPSIVDVDAETGVVTGKGDGSATITVTVDGKSASAQVKVLYVKPQTVAINPTSKTLVLNDTCLLNVLTTPAEVTYPEITWSSSNSSVASVDENGIVTAKGLGSATISAKVDGVVGTSTITVSEFPPITGFELSASATEVGINNSITLSIKNLEPSGASYGDIKWSIDNTSMATISVNKTNGTCTLTAKDQKGYVIVTAESNGVVKTQRIQITKIAVQSISVSSNVKSISGYYCFWAPSSASDYAETAYGSGQDIEFTVSVSPADASLAKNVKFESSNSNVQVKKVGNVYKLYVSSSAKGEYTLNVSCDGVSTQVKVHVIPNAYSPTISTIYGYPGKKTTIDESSFKSNINAYTPLEGLLKYSKCTSKTKNYHTFSEGSTNVVIIGKDLAYGDKYYDTFTVEADVLGRKITSDAVIYNSYYGISFDFDIKYGMATKHDETGYYYYISEGKKTSDCNLIGYDKPKFRAKVINDKVGDVTYLAQLTCYIYVHHYAEGGEYRVSGTCIDNLACTKVTTNTTRVDDPTETYKLPNTQMEYKFDFYD